ncbi:16S rRNA (cytidine(1402)-2'-O)-methyltransferase [Paenactinomyces guangxiensis]|uniref:Ribosomal RNA small subunit methyltransferase I n=1 Tax=Paenactinomyces guangxiensis TaxID=1490290 RepID=A0A7W1WTR0_9BACL|nr:16S rRNA (cytidine(1402)-2'-O)-methyltransferase [Paenactinomyces guangxiensis]MBA4495839.1 16S rRNA (cytidine(1402)-2'-O)-methyltransferase [Paenactinomyces guangxiensis]MBH8592929.1 16S rRNA (cytidine(1402)-2'-O)-methyltransferase [Paenactinomyces guangxiensis]
MKTQKSFETDQGVLYVVGTPIGNLQDFSPRAEEILKKADLIAAEDTRHTRKLLTHFRISTPLISYHEHNHRTRGTELINRLLEGESIALVSDAGMPGISDPGEELVREAVERGIPVIPISGPNAAITALVASGLQTQPFIFLGFLPRSSKERKEVLKRWMNIPATLICYEAPHRLLSMLTDALEILGDRNAAISRELTKKHEQWLRGTLSECIAYLTENGTRGEYTIVIEGSTCEEGEENQEENWWTSLPLVEHVEKYIKEGLSKKEAIRQTASDRSLPKREVYNQYHQSD